MDKKGEIFDESWKVVVAVILLAILIGAVILLLKGKGGDLFAAVSDMFKHGSLA